MKIYPLNLPLLRRTTLFWLLAVLLLGASFRLSGATVPPGFAEATIAGPGGGAWSDAVGTTFEDNGRMYVWARSGKIWIKDTSDSDFVQVLDISEEVGNWGDYGLLGFAVDPQF